MSSETRTISQTILRFSRGRKAISQECRRMLGKLGRITVCLKRSNLRVVGYGVFLMKFVAEKYRSDRNLFFNFFLNLIYSFYVICFTQSALFSVTILNFTGDSSVFLYVQYSFAAVSSV